MRPIVFSGSPSSGVPSDASEAVPPAEPVSCRVGAGCTVVDIFVGRGMRSIGVQLRAEVVDQLLCTVTAQILGIEGTALIFWLYISI